MGKAHINIGSNLGNSRSLIERAVAGIVLLSSDGEVRRSGWVVSEPWGFVSDSDFLNLGVEIDTSYAPDELLMRLLELQCSICDASHRTADGGYADRMIDIDLIFYDNMIMPHDWPGQGGEAVIVPHPRMHLRGFVLRPIAQLSPGWIHPVLHQTAVEMLRKLQS